MYKVLPSREKLVMRLLLHSCQRSASFKARLLTARYVPLTMWSIYGLIQDAAYLCYDGPNWFSELHFLEILIIHKEYTTDKTQPGRKIVRSAEIYRTSREAGCGNWEVPEVEG